MTTRGQNLRSSTPGQIPAAGTRQPGEIWLNFPDHQIGYIDASKTAQKAIAVRFFSTSANYASGDFVVQAGGIWVANASITAGAFNPSQWRELAYLTDIPAIYVLPIASTSVLGGVKVDGVTVQADANGVLSSAGLVSVSATPPSPVQNGALWYDLVGGQLYAWVDDGTSKQWVIAVNQNLAGGVWLPLTGGVLSGALSGPMATFANLSAPQAIGDNRIINGDMRIDQRFGGGPSGLMPASTIYIIDRWQATASVASKYTCGRNLGSLTTPPAFPYYFGVQSASAYTLLAGDTFNFSQPIEADLVSDFAWGTANAQPVTLSFWVFSSLTGTFGGSVLNTSGTRSYPFSYSIPVANTPTKIVVTIPGDTAGAWPMSGNAASMYIRFGFGVGSTLSGPANAWTNGTYNSAVGAVSVVSTNGANFYITGVKLEIGSVATPFNRQSLTKSMADCQRYYQIGTFAILSYSTVTGAVFGSFLPFPTVMRAAPTTIPIIFAGSDTNVSAVNTDTITNSGFRNYFTAPAVGNIIGIRNYTASAEL